MYSIADDHHWLVTVSAVHLEAEDLDDAALALSAHRESLDGSFGEQLVQSRHDRGHRRGEPGVVVDRGDAIERVVAVVHQGRVVHHLLGQLVHHGRFVAFAVDDRRHGDDARFRHVQRPEGDVRVVEVAVLHDVVLRDPAALEVDCFVAFEQQDAQMVDGGPVHVLLKHELSRRDWAEHRHYVVRFDFEVDARVA